MAGNCGCVCVFGAAGIPSDKPLLFPNLPSPGTALAGWNVGDGWLSIFVIYEPKVRLRGSLVCACVYASFVRIPLVLGWGLFSHLDRSEGGVKLGRERSARRQFQLKIGPSTRSSRRGKWTEI